MTSLSLRGVAAMYEINDPVDLVSSDSDANASLKHLKSVY
jgi:hypothetical protein